MFLKRIVLHGFKSFADRTEFEFGAGITSIVGPNGCGKSNVLDAVRWVLGEQSARSLRGGKMSDIIFSGSRSRKPANFAEVQLTFDNRGGILRSDQAEVSVARVLYRSGESEYRVNGNVARLKDIRELLLDTGVGVDAYSVIEQGRVDQLLQANPVERREIFEEAAGISRYKLRRIEAQRKLERTQDNLLRLQDIIDELEKRLRSVRLAAGKARNFQQYDARLRELRAMFSMAEYHGLEQARQQTTAEVAALDEGLRDERVALAAEDAELADAEHARQALDDEIQRGEAALLELQTRLSALAERIAQREQRLPELGEMRARRIAQAQELAGQQRQQQERLAAEEAVLAELAGREQACAALAAEREAARRSADEAASSARQALEREKIAAFDAVRRSALLQNEHENRTQQHERLGAQAERLRTRRRAAESERSVLEQQRAELSGRTSRLEEQLARLTDEAREDERRLSELQDAADGVDDEVNAAKESRSAVLSRLGLLEDLERRLEGVESGTRAVLAWREAPEVAELVPGLVADLLRIDDPRVALLQGVLADFESHIVVTSTPGLLAELDRRGARPEPLRVLGLDRLGGPPAPVSYEHAPGYVACAADWVRCAPEHRPLADHLLGRVFIVEELDQALALAAQALSTCTFVTLRGEIVTADGRLILGAAGAGAGLISRKTEIRQLRQDLEDIEARLVSLTRRRLELEQSISDVQVQKAGRLQEIATRQREHAELRSERTRVEDAVQRLAREDTLLADELAVAQKSLDEISARLAELARESATVDDTQKAHEERITALTAGLREHELVAVRLAHECTEALVDRGRAAEKRAAAEQGLREVRSRAQALQREQAAAQREADDAGRQIEQAQAELAADRARLATDTAACGAQRSELLGCRQRRQELLARLEEGGAAVRARQRRINEIETALHERQVALRECEVRRENLVQRVRDELALEVEVLYPAYQHAEQDWDAIRAEIEDLRGKIARLGHVNLDAIAELEELTPRYDHLVGQRDDLTTAIGRLQTLIAELDLESRTRFAAAFEQIRGHFQEMFRKLFGGGKADIVLEDPENPLECGIEIIARPPGKEPQALTLLSGGEKTMTAVALLMAVFRSRPSPFAILDEVDAALDEANIERFNNVLQEFLSHSQFVVITHSKRTMACADMLYGVTMEEPGVSKRVSVRFDDRVQTPNVA